MFISGDIVLLPSYMCRYIYHSKYQWQYLFNRNVDKRRRCQEANLIFNKSALGTIILLSITYPPFPPSGYKRVLSTYLFVYGLLGRAINRYLNFCWRYLGWWQDYQWDLQKVHKSGIKKNVIRTHKFQDNVGNTVKLFL